MSSSGHGRTIWALPFHLSQKKKRNEHIALLRKQAKERDAAGKRGPCKWTQGHMRTLFVVSCMVVGLLLLICGAIYFAPDATARLTYEPASCLVLSKSILNSTHCTLACKYAPHGVPIFNNLSSISHSSKQCFFSCFIITIIAVSPLTVTKTTR